MGKKDEVVRQSVGSNGTVFYLENRDDVVIETVEQDETDGRVVNLNKQEEKEPVRKGTSKVTAGGDCNINAAGGKAGGCSPQATANTVAFVAILLHALKCSSCDKPACKKMRMVLQHYKQCAFKRKVSLSEGSGGPGLQNCKICSQLLKIVAQHARSECHMQPGQKGCPVLMCDNFRAAMHKKQVQIKEPVCISAITAGSPPIILGT